jgi:hypothetical protein
MAEELGAVDLIVEFWEPADLSDIHPFSTYMDAAKLDCQCLTAEFAVLSDDFRKNGKNSHYSHFLADNLGSKSYFQPIQT